MNEGNQLEISLWKSTAAMWACFAFFAFCFIMSLVSGQPGAAPLFLPFIVACGLWLAFYRKVRANEKEIRLNSFFGEYRIEWADIDRIEKGQSLIVFFHGKKRLSIPLSCFWSGKDKKSLIQIIESVIQASDIEVKESFRADFLVPKATKHNQTIEGQPIQPPLD